MYLHVHLKLEFLPVYVPKKSMNNASSTGKPTVINPHPFHFAIRCKDKIGKS